MSAPTPAEAQSLLTALTRALAGVAVLTLVFTAVNVTLFATSRGVPWPIAILLDPAVALALSAILYADSRLAAWGIRPPSWSAALRWFTAIAATLMNTWDSIWPERQIRWPIHADLAGVVLHGVPTALLILLTETIAAYRRTIAPLLDQTGPADPTPAPTALAEKPGRSVRSGQPAVLPCEFTTWPADQRDAADAGAHIADSPPVAPPEAFVHPGHAPGTTDAALWQHAVTIDDAVRAATGRPVSVWRLRSELRLGPNRAGQIHTQLLQRHPTGEPPPS